MKRKAIFATMVALACALTSCLREDDLEMLNHPIHITGEIDPVLGFPVGTGEMNMNDLLTSLSATYDGVINMDDDTITVLYSMSASDTIKGSSFSKGPKAMPRWTAPVRKYVPGAKVDWFTKDTVIEEEIDIDFFDDVTWADSIFLSHVWVDLSVNVHGDIPEMFVDKANAVFDSVEIWYDDHLGVRKRYLNPALDTFRVPIPSLADTVMLQFPTIDIAPMVNDRPSKMIAKFHMKLNVDPAFIAQNIATMNLEEIVDSAQMSYLVYSAQLNVRMPLSIRVANMNYSFDVDMGEGLSSVNLDSILKTINEGLSAEVTDTKFRLLLDNGIPLNLIMTVEAHAADSSLLLTVFNAENIPSAATAPRSAIDPVEEAVAPTRTILERVLNKNEIELFKEAKYLKMDFVVSSNDKQVSVRRNDFLRLKAYLQVHPTVNVDIQL